MTASRITVRRSVPYDLDGGLRLTINAMRTDPDRVVLGLTGPGVAERIGVATGEVFRVAGDAWTVESIVVGDRGSVVLVAGAQ